MRLAIGVVLGGVTTVAGIALGLWLFLLIVETWFGGSPLVAFPLLALLELIGGGIGLLIGYRVYFRIRA